MPATPVSQILTGNPVTVKSRTRQLAKFGVRYLEDWPVLSAKARILDMIHKTGNPYSANTYLWAIISFLRVANLRSKGLLAFYEAEAARNKEKFLDKLKNNRLSQDRKSMMYLDPAEIIEKLNTSEARPEDKFLVGLYATQVPLRNDYAGMHIVDSPEEANDSSANYLITGPEPTFVINQYKTSSRYGTIVFKASDYIAKLLKEHPYVTSILEISENAMQKRIAAASRRVLGVPMSINSYRHVYEISLQKSDRYRNMTTSEREAEHARLGHSLIAGLGYNRV